VACPQCAMVMMPRTGLLGGDGALDGAKVDRISTGIGKVWWVQFDAMSLYIDGCSQATLPTSNA
jgi:hypothetical protein